LSGIIDQIAFEQGVDSHLVKAIITEESGFQSNAISSAGAVGLMQLMPATAQHYGAQDRFDIGQNLRAGIAYLGDMLRRYNGSVPLALAAYGMGPTEVDRCQCVPAVPVILTYIERVQALQAARPPTTGTLTAVNTTTPHRSAKP
jgi:soluble lytic murein transglycosylase-like protein